MWVSGFFGGVDILDIDKGVIKKFGDQQGFKKIFTGRIIEDHRGNMWIGSDNGVKIINPSLQMVKSIDQLTGLNSLDNNALIEDSRQQILIGTNAGLNIVNKDGRIITALVKHKSPPAGG